MKNEIMALCIIGILFAQTADVVSPSDGFAYTIKEMTRNINVVITDIIGDEVSQAKVRMEIQQQLYLEMNKEMQLGKPITALESKEIQIRNEIQTRIAAVTLGTTSASKDEIILQKQRERLQLEINLHEQTMTQQQTQLQTQLQEKSQTSIETMLQTQEQSGTSQTEEGQENQYKQSGSSS